MSSEPISFPITNGHKNGSNNRAETFPVTKDTTLDLDDPLVNEQPKSVSSDRGEKQHSAKDKNYKKMERWPFWLFGLAVLVAVIIAAITFNNNPTELSPPQITTTTTWKTAMTTTTEIAGALLSYNEPTSEPNHTSETETVQTINSNNILEPSLVLSANIERGELRRCDSSPDNSFECNTSGCVAATSVCDGHPQCPDQSDEWNCTHLDPKGILRLRRNSVTHHTVCGDNWNTEVADLMCAELGYVGATNFTVTSNSKRSKGYNIYQVAKKNRLAFELIDSTQCNQGILQLQCQEYHCGRKANKSTIDERYEDSRISGHTSCASLALAFSSNAAIKCAANIISPRWALTSYTCIMGKTEFMNNRNNGEMKWKLFAGLNKFTASEDQRPTPHIKELPQIVNIKRVVPYPQNKQSMYPDDVVLLELATPLQFNDVIGSVCLAETFSTIDPKQRCLTPGWESYFEDTVITEQYLMNVSAVNVHTGRCNSYNRELPDNTICVKPLISDQTTCYNDTGAPLMCYDVGTGQWQLQGVLSNQGNCDKRPAIYNLITPTIASWIRHTVGNGRMFELNNVNDKKYRQ